MRTASAVLRTLSHPMALHCMAKPLFSVTDTVGFVGGHLAGRLIDYGWEEVVIDNSGEVYRQNLAEALPSTRHA